MAEWKDFVKIALNEPGGWAMAPAAAYYSYDATGRGGYADNRGNRYKLVPSRDMVVPPPKPKPPPPERPVMRAAPEKKYSPPPLRSGSNGQPSWQGFYTNLGAPHLDYAFNVSGPAAARESGSWVDRGMAAAARAPERFVQATGGAALVGAAPAVIKPLATTAMAHPYATGGVVGGATGLKEGIETGSVSKGVTTGVRNFALASLLAGGSPFIGGLGTGGADAVGYGSTTGDWGGAAQLGLAEGALTYLGGKLLGVNSNSPIIRSLPNAARTWIPRAVQATGIGTAVGVPAYQTASALSERSSEGLDLEKDTDNARREAARVVEGARKFPERTHKSTFDLLSSSHDDGIFPSDQWKDYSGYVGDYTNRLEKILSDARTTTSLLPDDDWNALSNYHAHGWVPDDDFNSVSNRQELIRYLQSLPPEVLQRMNGTVNQQPVFR